MNKRSLCVRLDSVHILGKKITPSSLYSQYNSQVFGKNTSSSISEESEVPQICAHTVYRRKSLDTPLPSFMTEYLHESQHLKSSVRPRLNTRPSTAKTQKRREIQVRGHNPKSQSMTEVKQTETKNEEFKPQRIRISPRSSIMMYTKQPVLQLELTPVVTGKELSKRKARVARPKTVAKVEENKYPDFTDVIAKEAAETPAFTFGEKLWKLNVIAATLNYI